MVIEEFLELGGIHRHPHSHALRIAREVNVIADFRLVGGLAPAVRETILTQRLDRRGLESQRVGDRSGERGGFVDEAQCDACLGSGIHHDRCTIAAVHPVRIGIGEPHKTLVQVVKPEIRHETLQLDPLAIKTHGPAR